jgi:flagellar basal-body rod protein FlgG
MTIAQSSFKKEKSELLFMIYGVNTAVSACVKKLAQLDYVTNNLANVNTPGFKAERLTFVRRPETPALEENTFSHDLILFTDQSYGTLQKTGNPLDAAVEGDGYFVVQGGDGNSYYTRNGGFTINRDKLLVTSSGDPVLGQGGPITVDGKKVEIGHDGTVNVDGKRVNALRVVKFSNREALVRIGKSRYQDPGSAGLQDEEKPAVQSGYLELSNVQTVKEMIDMIDIHRHVEAYLKVMQTISEQDKLAVSRLGKLYL